MQTNLVSDGDQTMNLSFVSPPSKIQCPTVLEIQFLTKQQLPTQQKSTGLRQYLDYNLHFGKEMKANCKRLYLR